MNDRVRRTQKNFNLDPMVLDSIAQAATEMSVKESHALERIVQQWVEFTTDVKPVTPAERKRFDKSQVKIEIIERLIDDVKTDLKRASL